MVERGTSGPRHPGFDLLDGHSVDLLRRLGLATLVCRESAGPDHPTGLEWRRDPDAPPIISHPDWAPGGAGGSGAVPVESHRLVSSGQFVAGLRDAVRRHPLIDFREGWTFTGLRAEPDGVVAEVVEGGSGDRHFIAAGHLAGCDGAYSTVRYGLEVSMEPLATPVRHCSIHFRSAALTRRLARRGFSTLIIGGVAAVTRGDRDTWVGHLSLAPEESIVPDPVADLRALLDVPLEPSDVLDVTQWDDSLAVASTYQRGPVYLLGEAAHRFHPLTGSADVGVGDAVDLGWKLAAVINGWGGPALLASYEAERRPRALIDRELLARAVESRRRFSRLAKVGATPELLARVLHQEPCPLGRTWRNGDRLTSPLILPDDPLQWSPAEVPHAVAPGGLVPAIRLADGSELLDQLGPELTLVDLTVEEAGRPLVAAARKRGIPMAHLVTGDPAVRTRWNHPLVLVRPDQHVAWHAKEGSDDWESVLDLVTGHKTT